MDLSKLQKDAIQIAEFKGWKQIEGSLVCWGKNGQIKTLQTLVNDISDLNTFHEAELEAPYEYWNKLAELTGALDAEHFAKACHRICQGTLEQRRKAFIYALDNPEE